MTTTPTHEGSPGAPPADHLRFERLISDTSARLLHASPEEVGAAIETAIGDVRRFFRADRCALLVVDADPPNVHVSVISTADGVPEVSGTIELAELFPWTYRRLVVDGVPVVTRPADLPPEAAVDRASNEQMGIRTALAVPLVTSHRVGHLIVLNAVTDDREWPLEFVPRLRVLGEMVVAGAQRQRAFASLAEREAGLRERTARLEAAVETAELGFTDRHVGSSRLFVDARMQHLLGIGPVDVPNAEQVWLSRIHIADREEIAEVSRQLQSGDLDRAVREYRYEHPTRGVIWLRHGARRLETEGMARIFSAVQDITDRRRREEALQAAHEEEKRKGTQLERENLSLRKAIADHASDTLVTGHGPAVSRALALADQVAATASTVLLIGETGTGKERFAAHIHRASPRRSRHMVRVNCSAIPAALMESELFGREKGAYTGALSKQIGRFELAQGSTLFLDEIGDLPMELQVKLLRVLQERTIERLGSPMPIEVDVRIVAATNRDLEAAVRQGSFRSDLYYRLNVFPIVVPPLRERLEDLPSLVATLVDELGRAMRKPFTAVDRASLEALALYDWPGNVRELRNILERAMILSPGPTLTVAPPATHIASLSTAAGVSASASPIDLRHMDREHILRVLEATGWRIRGKNAAAELLGLKPTTLEARMAKLGINRPGTHRND